MNAVLEVNYVQPISLKLQKHYRVFEALVMSFPINYFNRADVLDLEEVSRITVLMSEQMELMRLNKPDTKQYDNAANLYLRFSKQILQYKNSLRITNVSRNGANRGKEPVNVPLTDDNRNKVISASPWDSGVPVG